SRGARADCGRLDHRPIGGCRRTLADDLARVAPLTVGEAGRRRGRGRYQRARRGLPHGREVEHRVATQEAGVEAECGLTAAARREARRRAAMRQRHARCGKPRYRVVRTRLLPGLAPGTAQTQIVGELREPRLLADDPGCADLRIDHRSEVLAKRTVVVVPESRRNEQAILPAELLLQEQAERTHGEVVFASGCGCRVAYRLGTRWEVEARCRCDSRLG